MIEVYPSVEPEPYALGVEEIDLFAIVESSGGTPNTQPVCLRRVELNNATRPVADNRYKLGKSGKDSSPHLTQRVET
jgi:hypothetical protein